MPQAEHASLGSFKPSPFLPKGETRNLDSIEPKAIKFQVPINLHFIKTHPAYIKTETVKEIKRVGHILRWMLLNSPAK